MATEQGYGPRRQRLLCALAVLSVLLAAPAQAITTADGAPAARQSETDDDAALDREAVSREIERFRSSAISLSQAIAIAEATHAGSTAADISFDGEAATPIYRVKTVHNDRMWQHAIDATTGRIVGGEAAVPLTELEPEDRHNLVALKAIRHHLLDAVHVAEHAASGKAISGGLIREGGRLNFAIVVVSGNDLKQVILQPPRAHRP
ncbi:PepSY domain-containing protein [Bradyrhizobium sp. STM 3557]|uniref:PepSY domain-containing protein n=1 Tax=Bradyrhizobium sp. STM 3557 TaxID=578920 RepID=UPI00388F8993